MVKGTQQTPWQAGVAGWQVLHWGKSEVEAWTWRKWLEKVLTSLCSMLCWQCRLLWFNLLPENRSRLALPLFLSSIPMKSPKERAFGSAQKISGEFFGKLGWSGSALPATDHLGALQEEKQRAELMRRMSCHRNNISEYSNHQLSLQSYAQNIFTKF